MGLVLVIIGGIILYYGGRWILAVVAILTGSKAALHEVGSLCEDDMPPPIASAGFEQWQQKWDQHYDWRNQGDPK